MKCRSSARTTGLWQREREGFSGYVGLAHKEQYKLRITNNAPTRAAFQFSLDGTKWAKPLFLDAGATADIETIPDTGKRLTFFAKGTEEGRAANLPNGPELGLVSAKITQERPPAPAALCLDSLTRGPDFLGRGAMGGGGATKGLGAGISGLSGYSSQQFCGTYFDQDSSKPPVTLTVRLAHDPERRVLDAAPIPGRAPTANEVPPPIGDDDDGMPIKPIV